MVHKLFLLFLVVPSFTHPQESATKLLDYDSDLIEFYDPYNRCPHCLCGQTEVDSEWRIVGGWPTKPKQYPWVVAVVTKKSNRLFCGGALISDIYVLTAAHCIKGYRRKSYDGYHLEHCKKRRRREGQRFLVIDTNRYMKAKELEIVISDGDHVDMKPGCSERRQVEELIIHKSFDSPRAYNNDIGLMKLNKPVNLGTHRSPVCLPEPGKTFAGEMARIVGWGKTMEKGNRSTWLREASVPILNQKTCTSLSGFMTITEGMMCASPLAGGVDACQGDSGGPLLVKEDRRISIAGIVSWGIGCARPNKPGIYTRVNHYIPWIIENTKDGCFCF